MNNTENRISWLGYHVFIPHLADKFMVDFILPELLRLKQQGLLKRFFYIRYSEGGPHVRLRFLPTPSWPVAAVEQKVRSLVTAFTRSERQLAPLCRVEVQPYDRATHYFGENLRSVYAELLNEQSSYLALRLMRSDGSNLRRMAVLLAVLLDLLVRKGCTTEIEAQTWLVRQCAFAREQVTLRAPGSLEASATRASAWVDMVTRWRPSVQEALCDDPLVERMAALLRRVRREQVDGFEVAAHALHLLCNKLGYGLVQEYWLFETLCLVHGLPCELEASWEATA
jgi:thiopeptide-type bacteriocin biosynthesis protein